MLKWPIPEDDFEELTVQVDDLTTYDMAWDSHAEYAVAAAAHALAAEYAADLVRQYSAKRDEGQVEAFQSLACERAITAKQMLAFAQQHLDQPQEARWMSSILQRANRSIIENHDNGWTELIQDDRLQKATAEAELNTRLIQTLAKAIKDPTPDDPMPPRIREMAALANIRTVAQMAVPHRFQEPLIIHHPVYMEQLGELHYAAQPVLDQHHNQLKTMYPDEEMAQKLWAAARETIPRAGTTNIWITTSADEDMPPDQTTIHMMFLYQGIKHFTTIADPFPPGYPAYRAHQAAEACRRALAQASAQDDGQFTRSAWQQLHNMQAAIANGVHDISTFHLDMLADSIYSTDGYTRAINTLAAQAMALDNHHAARFIAGSHPGRYTSHPTIEQAQAVINAARSAGINDYQMAPLAEAMGHNPASLGVLRTPVNKNDVYYLDIMEDILPEQNHRNLLQTMNNPNW